MCSGSLIAPNLVLTAGHCIHDSSRPFGDPELDISYSSTFILLGSSDYDKSDWAQNSKIVRVKKAIHHGYGDNLRFPFDGDIALLELEECVDTIPGLIETIKVATKSTEPAGGQCLDVKAVGYGMVSNAPDPLNDSDGRRRYIHDTLHGHETCKNAFIAAAMDWTVADQGTASPVVRDSVTEDHFICTGGSSIHSVCYGDSGGPTVFTISPSDSSLQVVGATSFGFGAVCTLSPDFSTRVSFHAAWIRSSMEDGTFGTCPGWEVKNSFASWPVNAWTDADLSDQFKASRCGLDDSKWQCSSGPCILKSQVCDGKSDCADRSDEDSAYCSYVSTYGKNRRLSSSGSSELLDELDALIDKHKKNSDLAVKMSQTDGEMNLKSSSVETQSGITIVGILKSRALRMNKEKTFAEPVTLSGKSAVECGSGYTQYQVAMNQAVDANTIDDQWNAQPLKNACQNLLTCTGFASSAVGEGKTFCNEFLEYLAANATLSSYASNFKARFDPICPSSSGNAGSGSWVKDDSPSTTTKSVVSSISAVCALLVASAIVWW